jgi:hypothetical protein
VGHRTLVAVERADGRFDCYRSQWSTVAALGADPAAIVESVPAGERPVASGVCVDRVLGLLDPVSDERLLVRTHGSVTPYRVRPLDVPAAETADPGDTQLAASGAPVVLLPAPDRDAVERLDVALRTAKGILGDAVDAGLVSQAAAERYLVAFVGRHPDLPDGALWLTPGEVREV